MTGVDTNMLVYSHRMDSPHFAKAEYHMTKLAEGPSWWAIPWPCIHKFLAVVTNPRLFLIPTPLAEALDQVEAWLESPMLRMIGEAAGYWVDLKQIMIAGKVVGPMTHDARIVAICRQHGVRTIWSADGKFPRIPGIKVVNPLLEEA